MRKAIRKVQKAVNNEQIKQKNKRTKEQKSTTSRSTGGVEEAKAAKIEKETSLQRVEGLEVLGKPKEERLRRRQVKNEQSNSRC